MEFIANAEFVEEYSTVHEKVMDDLKNADLNFLSSISDTIKVGTGAFVLHNQKKALHFATSDQSHWIDIIQYTKGDTLFNYWEQASKKIGIKDEIKNDEGGTVFFRVKTTANGVLGALFNTGRNIFNIEISLPFAVPETYNELNANQQLLVKQKFDELYTILELMAHHYVKPAALVYMPTSDKNLTAEQRLYGLIQFWTEVKYNFAFFDQVPNLDWDQVLQEYLPVIEKDQSTKTYYRNLEKMCALLKDGHTNVYPPAYLSSRNDYPAVRLVNIQHKAMVENVADSLKNEIPIGSEVISVNQIPVEKYLQENIFPYISSSTTYVLYDWGIRDLLNGEKGTIVIISLKTPAGKQKQVSLTRNAGSSKFTWAKQQNRYNWLEFNRLQGNIAYVALNSFGYDQIAQEFEKQIDTINTCAGLIIDLRNNGGGNSDNGYVIINHLTDQPYLTSQWSTREHRAAYKAWGKFYATDYRNNNQEEKNNWEKTAIDYYKGNKWYTLPSDTIVPPDNKKINLPLIVLIGHGTASAAEDFLIALDNLDRATLVGERTFGSTGQPLFLNLPGGGTARICTKKDTYPDGKEFVGYGIEPDVYIESTVEDFIQSNDPVLKKAVDMLLGKQ